ncbi:MAG: GNAT family N-acetyltransferase [Myxococcota bacterium]
MVRLAHLADAPVLARIESRAWRKAYTTLLPEARLAELASDARLAHWRSRLRSNGRREGRAILVATRGGEPVGYVSLGPADHPDLEPGFAGEVFELYVDPDHQGQGIGSELLEAAFDALRQAGLGWAVLEVLVDNAPARAFYAAQGLLTEGRTRRRTTRDTGYRATRYSLSRSSVRVIRYETSLWDLRPSLLAGPEPIR